MGSQGAPLSSLDKVCNLGNPSAASSCLFAPFSSSPVLSQLLFLHLLCWFLFLPIFQCLCLFLLSNAFSPLPQFFFFPPCLPSLHPSLSFSLFFSLPPFPFSFILPPCHSFPPSPHPSYPLLRFHLVITLVASALNSEPGRGAPCRDKTPTSSHKPNAYSTHTHTPMYFYPLCPAGGLGLSWGF